MFFIRFYVHFSWCPFLARHSYFCDSINKIGNRNGEQKRDEEGEKCRQIKEEKREGKPRENKISSMEIRNSIRCLVLRAEFSINIGKRIDRHQYTIFQTKVINKMFHFKVLSPQRGVTKYRSYSKVEQNIVRLGLFLQFVYCC